MSTDTMAKTTLFDYDNVSVADQSHYSASSPTPSLSFDKSAGWIVVHTTGDHEQNIIQLCWLPVELRGSAFDAHESMFAIASDSNHQLTIIDFNPMLTMLHQLGVMP
jgi:hypothetical protein